MPPAGRSDDALLTSGDPEAFGVFYDRHVRDVLAYMMRRTGDPETAADLTAETFAAAIVARRRYRPGKVPANGWLFTIAQRRLVDHQRRGYAEQRLRRRLGMERRVPGEEDTAMIRLLGDGEAVERLRTLPADQRTAVRARVVDERDYAEIAAGEGVPETAVRMRVSRGLATLRKAGRRTG
jgi:RNA polymerase sigma factor (sigma-70 family)